VASEDIDGGFDSFAAGLRFDGEELRTSVEVLASKLEGALPAHTRVERAREGLLRRGGQHVQAVLVELAGNRYVLRAGSDRVECYREREVGGISIKRVPLEPSAWVGALTDDLRAESERSAEAREALARLLA